METDLLPNVRGTVQSLKNIWSTRVAENEKSPVPPLIRPTSGPKQQRSQLQQPIKEKIPSSSFINLDEKNNMANDIDRSTSTINESKI